MTGYFVVKVNIFIYCGIIFYYNRIKGCARNDRYK